MGPPFPRCCFPPSHPLFCSQGPRLLLLGRVWACQALAEDLVEQHQHHEQQDDRLTRGHLSQILHCSPLPLGMRDQQKGPPPPGTLVDVGVAQGKSPPALPPLSGARRTLNSSQGTAGQPLHIGALTDLCTQCFSPGLGALGPGLGASGASMRVTGLWHVLCGPEYLQSPAISSRSQTARSRAGCQPAPMSPSSTDGLKQRLHCLRPRGCKNQGWWQS